jgi:hypothetical protein
MDIKDIGLGIDMASLVFCNIGISFLSANTAWLRHNVLKSMRWKTSFATMIVEVTGTVNELLLRERSEGLILEELMSLESSNG